MDSNRNTIVRLRAYQSIKLSRGWEAILLGTKSPLSSMERIRGFYIFSVSLRHKMRNTACLG